MTTKKKEKPKNTAGADTNVHNTNTSTIKDKKKKKTKTKDTLPTSIATARYSSSSSFEAGAPSPTFSGAAPGTQWFHQRVEAEIHEKEMGSGLGVGNGEEVKRKSSMLSMGLGLPSTLSNKFGTMRAFSSGAANRLSATSSSSGSTDERRSSLTPSLDIPGEDVGRARSTSTRSATSSLRPHSTSSGTTRTSSSSVMSVKWDEAKLGRERERKRVERAESAQRLDSEGRERDTRSLSEARKRTALMDIFPAATYSSTPKSTMKEEKERPISGTSNNSNDSTGSASFSFRSGSSIPEPPIVMVQEPTLDDARAAPARGVDAVVFRGEDYQEHPPLPMSMPTSVSSPADAVNSSTETPSKQAGMGRRRPVSEQVMRALREERPQAITDDVDGTFLFSSLFVAFALFSH